MLEQEYYLCIGTQTKRQPLFMKDKTIVRYMYDVRRTYICTVINECISIINTRQNKTGYNL